MNIDLDQIVEVRRWDPDEGVETLTLVSLRSAIEIPYNLQLADLGFYLLNAIRKDMGLDPLPYSSYEK
jgi:hypothetical protein